MTKDEFLLKQISEWWDCIRDSEITETLDPEEVKKFYPEYDPDDEDGDDITDEIMKDATVLLEKLSKMLKG